jgi:phage recombination protein Bet
MTNELATRRNGAPLGTTTSLAQRTGWSQEQIDLIKKTVAKDSTDVELEWFLTIARRSGLDPISKQIYFIKRGGTPSIQTGIDGFRSIAEDSGEYDGQDAPVFTFDEKNKLDTATVTVWRKSMSRGVSATAPFVEFNQGNAMWQKMPRTMLAKCAEAAAIRKAFPKKLSGIYSAEEMGQAQNEHRILNASDSGDVYSPEEMKQAPPAISKAPKSDAKSTAELQAMFDAANIPGTFKDWLVEHIAPDLMERQKKVLFIPEAIEAARQLVAYTAVPEAEFQEVQDATDTLDDVLDADEQTPPEAEARPVAATRKAKPIPQALRERMESVAAGLHFPESDMRELAAQIFGDAAPTIELADRVCKAMRDSSAASK